MHAVRGPADTRDEPHDDNEDAVSDTESAQPHVPLHVPRCRQYELREKEEQPPHEHGGMDVNEERLRNDYCQEDV